MHLVVVSKMNLNKYELTLILDPNLSDGEVEAMVEQEKAFIAESGGTVVSADIIGRRLLAYPIAKRDSGVYVLVVFESPSDFNKPYTRRLKLDEKVMRSLIVVKDKFAPDLSPTARDFLTSAGADALALEDGDLEEEEDLDVVVRP